MLVSRTALLVHPPDRRTLPMPINAACPTCNKPYVLADSQLSKRVRCRHCDDTFVVSATPMAPRASEPIAQPDDAPTYGLQPDSTAPPPLPPGRSGPPRMIARPQPRSEFIPRQSPSSPLPSILLIASGLVLLVGLIVGAVLSSPAGGKPADKKDLGIGQVNNDNKP